MFDWFRACWQALFDHGPQTSPDTQGVAQQVAQAKAVDNSDLRVPQAQAIQKTAGIPGPTGTVLESARKWSTQQLAAQCRTSGILVGPLPSSISGVQLLWALAGNESSFGADCSPRHEPAFDVGGAYGPPKNAQMSDLIREYPPVPLTSYKLICTPRGAPSTIQGLTPNGGWQRKYSVPLV